MKLNKQQQQQWSIVTSVFSALSRAISDPELLKNEMAIHVSEFEGMTGGEVKVKIRTLPTPSIELVDCSKDFLQVTRDDEGVSTLRARIEGISFSSTIAYKEKYKHSNGAVVDGLRALADSLDKLPVEMRDQTGKIDIFSLIGVSHGAGVSDDDEDAPETPEASGSKELDEDKAFIELVKADDDSEV
jgi:hypothetical protein